MKIQEIDVFQEIHEAKRLFIEKNYENPDTIVIPRFYLDYVPIDNRGSFPNENLYLMGLKCLLSYSKDYSVIALKLNP
jgi:hypothetical protein